MNTINDYDSFFLPVDDLNEAKDYYENILGLPLKFNLSERGILGFKVGSQEPAIILKDRNKHPSAKLTIWFEVDDVNDLYDKLKNKGVKFLSEPFQINKGIAVEFEDPFGNRLGFTSYKERIR